MSASNWGICPGCLAGAERDKTLQTQAAESAYGKVSIAEFERIRSLANKDIDKEDFRTFREDYEIYIEGTDVIVGYSGSCETCGTTADFESKHPISLRVRKT